MGDDHLFEFAKAIPCLEELAISRTLVSPRGLSALAVLPNLTQLHAESMLGSKKAAVAQLNRLTTLRHLAISSSLFPAASLPLLNGLSALQSLVLGASLVVPMYNANDMRLLCVQFPALTALNLSGVHFSLPDKSYELFQTLSSLRTLRLSEHGLTKRQVVEWPWRLMPVQVSFPGDYTIRAPMVAAARVGLEASVKEMFYSGGDVNQREEDSGQTPLMMAASNGAEELVRFLLDHGANVAAQDVSGFTALLMAAAEGHVGAVRLLLSQGASVAESNALGETALMLAVMHGHLNIVSLLVEDFNADLHSRDEHGSTPILCATMYGDIHCLRCALFSLSLMPFSCN